MSPAPRDWFDYASALTPLLVALFVAYIAYRQWRVARQKLRLDLYNKRFAVFETTLRFYQDLLGESNSAESEPLHRQFITAMIESRFLFATSSGISQLMTEFNKAAFVIKGSRDILKTYSIPPEMKVETHSRLIQEHQGLELKLNSLERAMAPYLSFRGLLE